MIVVLKRGQIGKVKGPHCLDISVKSSLGWATNFAPTWKMVLDYKNGSLNKIEYENKYKEILLAAGENNFKKLWQTGINNKNKLTLCCYCQNGTFCHTHLLIEFAVANYPQWFSDGRTNNKSKKKDKEMQYLLAVDLETTGLKLGYHEITQIAAIMLDKNLNELGAFDTLVRINYPERGKEHGFDVFQYTGIKVEDLQKAPSLKDALRYLETFARAKIGGTELGKIVMFGQNPAFDKAFLEEAFKQQGWHFPFDFHVVALESMYVYNHLLKTGELPTDLSLKGICKTAKVENKQIHNAMSDIRATVDILHKFCDKKSDKVVEKTEEQVKSTPRRRNVRGKR